MKLDAQFVSFDLDLQSTQDDSLCPKTKGYTAIIMLCTLEVQGDQKDLIWWLL